ncbi:DegT/DnrJ/EryC1/StrS family aminotransferase [Tessaracoccus sp. OS52]|uniref:DegT/DnrJ/EryC1/StrS family aminotransferase n=1 Tax=Tessaracoccus sp. OS52 TaxID=2886691 RepID=UPI001D126B04|nr:DegT/DnrJ/EryC1/StrS family aminotransferase [Tessaracoccus sp. OS52]MCC2593287.1 DegT/DnrJ/EryC1/StrS family aminotransferase [Tessaracoccus sp. OS52]
MGTTSPYRNYPTYETADGRRFGQEEEAAVLRVIRSGHLSRVGGTETIALESEFAQLMGMPHAVASATGSAAIHCAVAALDLEPGDEIIVPPITDAGSMIGALAQGLVPVFADVDPKTGCLTAESVAAAITERTRVVVVVHLFGGAADVEAITELCHRRGIRVIEDCAQAYLATTPSGALVGTVGDIGCFSLQQSKHITTGDGGLLVTADAGLARRAALFADKGWPRDTGERTHLFLGLNYRMTDLVAAVARAQLGKVSEVVADRRRIAEGWSTALRRPGVSVPDAERHSFWLYPLVLEPAVVGGTNRDLVELLADTGLSASAGYLQRVLYRNPVLTERRTFGSSGWPLSLASRPAPECPVAEDLVRSSLVTVGINENFTPDDAAAAAAALGSALDELALRKD